MFKNKQSVKSRELVRAELGESLDHALRAAGHAAGGVRATVGPKVGPATERVRTAASDGWGSTKEAFGPLSEAAQAELQRARKQAKKQKAKLTKRGRAKLGKRSESRRWPALLVIAGGVAVGAVAVAALRRQQQKQLEDEYGPADVLESEPGLSNSSSKPDTAAGD